MLIVISCAAILWLCIEDFSVFTFPGVILNTTFDYLDPEIMIFHSYSE